MNNDEIVNDFRRRYEGAFIQLCAEQKGINVIGKMNKIRADNERLATLEIVTKEFGTIQMNMGSEEYQIKFAFPKAGVFQYMTDAVVFERRAEKQYQRGLSTGNGRFMSVTAPILGNASVMSLDTVKAAFDHKQFPLKVALASMKAGHMRSVALDDNFAISLPFGKTASHCVWHRQTLVGGIDNNGKLARVYEPVFEKALLEMTHGN